MKRIACQYVIVRFMPYVETGEFANVGVVMISPRDRYFGFKLETRRYARLTSFFKDLEGRLYRSAIYAVKQELERVHALRVKLSSCVWRAVERVAYPVD